MGAPRPYDLAALKQKFKDFDDPDVYKKVEEVAKDENAKNFVVQFGAHKARIAFDLDAEDLSELAACARDEECPIRWINLWNTTKQRDAIESLGKYYGFTRRLRASIIAWDKSREDEKRKNRELDGIHTAVPGREPDLEQGLNGMASKRARSQVKALQPGQTSATSADGGRNSQQRGNNMARNQDERNNVETAYFKIVQSSMNYTTVDHGSKFTCIGANWLHKRPGLGRLVPPKHWSWLTLCTSRDNADTVISIHEAPNLEEPPKEEKDPFGWRMKELKMMRHNTLAVLEQISAIGIKKYEKNALSLKAIREPLGRPPSGPSGSAGPAPSATTVPPHRMAEVGASNLFYYLFEDTVAVVDILEQAKMMLEDLTQQVLERPLTRERIAKSTIIPRLHDLGKELRLLQHLFKSYKLLIQTILAPPDTDISEQRVRLDQQARDRFKRLGDRLQLLMLNTIKEYLDEKSELSSTYFNLTAQKDSEATARLTQSATLLAKLSVFFLPISFLTGYFSIEIPGMMDSYTSNTYWVSFGVTAFISFLFLFFFSRLLIGLSDQLDAVSERIDTYISKTLGAFKNLLQRDAAKDRVD